MKARISLVLALLSMLSFNSMAEVKSFPATSRVIGGNPVAGLQYPWMVSLQKREPVTNPRGVVVDEFYWHLCGAFQVNSEWVVTAAHCFVESGFSASDVVAVIGQLDINNLNDSEYRVIDHVIAHPEYDVVTAWDQDIALVHLAEPLRLTEYAPIGDSGLLANLNSGDTLDVMGWGYVDNEGTESNTLLQAQMTYVSRNACESIWGGNITHNMICAGGSGQTDPCSGDSGGPLFSDNEAATSIIGIVSWGSNTCADPGVPSVFTLLPNYLNWIQGVTDNLIISSPQDFGIWPKGYEQTKEITLLHQSDGIAPILVNSLQLAARAFNLVSDDCTGHSLNPGMSCQISLKFEAGNFQDESGQLIVHASSGSIEADLKGRSAQEPQLADFTLPAAVNLTTVDESPLGLTVINGELVAKAWVDNQETLFYLEAKTAGQLLVSFSMQGGEAQYLLIRTEQGYLLDSREGGLEHEELSYRMEQGEFIRFAFTGFNSNEDEVDQLIIHSIDFEPDQPVEPEPEPEPNAAGSGGGVFHGLWLLLLAVPLSCRKIGAGKLRFT